MATPKDPRERLAKAADSAVQKGIVTLENALDMEKWQACPKCNTRVFFKDVRALTEALKFFMDYGYGKPETRKPQREEIKIEGKKIEELSDEELFALLGEDQDGKTVSSSAQEAAQEQVRRPEPLISDPGQGSRYRGGASGGESAEGWPYHAGPGKQDQGYGES